MDQPSKFKILIKECTLLKLTVRKLRELVYDERIQSHIAKEWLTVDASLVGFLGVAGLH